MKRYIGTKIINAKPMTRGDYNALRGWTVQADENPADEGYLVEYTDGGSANMEGFAGYVSWSPKDVFGRAYKPTPTEDSAIEQAIQAKGKTAPRITPADIEASIACEHYFTAADGAIGVQWNAVPRVTIIDTSPGPLHLLTFCVLVLKNGFTVTGESACASPENFDAEIGRKIARANAWQKIWPLMGYALRDRLKRDSFAAVQTPIPIGSPPADRPTNPLFKSAGA